MASIHPKPQYCMAPLRVWYLAPLLFTMYTISGAELFGSHSLWYNFYVEANQICSLFDSSSCNTFFRLLSSASQEVLGGQPINSLMGSRNLCKNYFCCWACHISWKSVNSLNLQIGSHLLLKVVDSVCNLGVVFNSSMSLTVYASSICKSSYMYVIRTNTLGYEHMTSDLSHCSVSLSL